MKPTHARALEYIRNTGGAPSIEAFDDDHEPIGRILREEMKDLLLIAEVQGRVIITKPPPQ